MIYNYCRQSRIIRHDEYNFDLLKWNLWYEHKHIILNACTYMTNNISYRPHISFSIMNFINALLSHLFAAVCRYSECSRGKWNLVKRFMSPESESKWESVNTSRYFFFVNENINKSHFLVHFLSLFQAFTIFPALSHTRC